MIQSAYSGDVTAMTEAELLQSLELLAKSWREKSHLANEEFEGRRYNEIREALHDRFGVRMSIELVDGTHILR